MVLALVGQKIFTYSIFMGCVVFVLSDRDR